MAIKKYLKIKGWDILDKFFGEKVEGLHITLEKTFPRAFCRCGETIASDGNVHKCPKCGNINFKEYGSHYYSNDIVTPAVKYIVDESLSPTSYKIYEHRLLGDVDVKREVITFKEDNFLLYEFLEREIKETVVSYLRYCIHPLGDELSNMIKAWPYYSRIEPFIEKRGTNINISYVKDALKIYNSFEVTSKDDLFIQYPNLGHCIVAYLNKNRAKMSFKENLPLKDYLDKLLIDDEFLNVYNNICKYSGYWRNEGIFEIYHKDGSSWRDSGELIYKIFQEKKKENSIGYKIIVPYVKNEVINLQVGLKLIERINQINFERVDILENDETFEELLRTYLKENIVIKSPGYIIEDFFRDIDILEEMKIPVTKENLKLKNMNYFLNRSRLSSTYRIPEDKAECFVDLFEKDPLKAIELLENRRKMTKKQMDAFIDEMTN